MQYCVGDKIISKKSHACGCNEWEVTRTGADVKIKCINCGRALFLSVDEVKKITKQHIPQTENEKSNV